MYMDTLSARYVLAVTYSNIDTQKYTPTRTYNQKVVTQPDTLIIMVTYVPESHCSSTQTHTNYIDVLSLSKHAILHLKLHA